MKVDAGLYLLSRLVVAGVQLILLPFAIFQLGTEGYGVYILLVQTGLLLRVLISEHVTQTVLREFSFYSSAGTERAFVALGWKYLSISAVIISAVALLGFVFSEQVGLSAMQWSLAMAFGLSMAAYSYLLTLYLSRMEIRKAAFIEVIHGLLGVILPIGIGTLYPAAAAYGAGAVIASLCICLPLFMVARIGVQKDERRATLHIWPVMRTYGLPLTAGYVLYWIVGVADRFQIAGMLGTYDVGLYTASYQLLVAPVNLVIASLITVWQPYLFATDKSSARTRLIRCGTMLFAIGVGYILVGTICGPWMVALLSGNKINPSYTLVALLAAAGVGQGFANLATLWAKHCRQTTAVFQSLILAATVVLAGNLFLIPVMGISAAAMTTLLAYGAQAMYLLARARAINKW